MKNRESAQASRERKKNYVNDLEKTVNKLTENTKKLNTQLSSLEEENLRLKEQLLKATNGEKLDISIEELQPLKKTKSRTNSTKVTITTFPKYEFFTIELLVRFI